MGCSMARSITISDREGVRSLEGCHTDLVATVVLAKMVSRERKDFMELGNRDSGDQLKWTTASSREEVGQEYIVGSSEITSSELRN